MIIEGEKFSGTFMNRPNRFLAFVRINGEAVACYLPDPGRLKELLLPGIEVVVRRPPDLLMSRCSPSCLYLGKRENARDERGRMRKTKYDLLAAVINGNGEGRRLVSLDTRLPNKLVHEALLNRRLENFKEYDKVTPEFCYGSSRLDFFLENQTGRKRRKCLLEVKACNLVVNGVALFPDAPTVRGTRHLRELTKAKSLGDSHRACVLFIVQRDDAKSLEPNRCTDPKFAEALCVALSKGVEAYAYTTNFDAENMTLAEPIPINVAGG
jgi:sugar fermentation stimulation protein A